MPQWHLTCRRCYCEWSWRHSASRPAATTQPRKVVSRATLHKVDFFFCLSPEQTASGLRFALQRLIQGQYLRSAVAMAIGFVFNYRPVYPNSCGSSRMGNDRQTIGFLFLTAKSERLNLQNAGFKRLRLSRVEGQHSCARSRSFFYFIFFSLPAKVAELWFINLFFLPKGKQPIGDHFCHLMSINEPEAAGPCDQALPYYTVIWLMLHKFWPSEKNLSPACLAVQLLPWFHLQTEGLIRLIGFSCAINQEVVQKAAAHLSAHSVSHCHGNRLFSAGPFLHFVYTLLPLSARLSAITD